MKSIRTNRFASVSPRRFFTVLSFLVLGSTVAWGQKTVICIDGCGSGFVSNHEGYARSIAMVGDVIQVGGNLDDCLAMLADGDSLILVAHGTGTGTGFIWGGMTYTGFGAGAGQHPVPAGFGNLMNISFDFCSCWSARDPDGGGTNTSLVDKLNNAMGGGHTGNGFNDLATSSVCYTVSGGSEAQRQAAITALDNNTAWMDNPPTNRPGATTTQRTAAQDLVDSATGTGGAGNLTVTIDQYKQPVNALANPPGASGCGCTGPPGCGFGTQDATSLGGIPDMTIAARIVLAVALPALGLLLLAMRTQRLSRPRVERA